MALPNNKKPYNPYISSRKLNKKLEFVFDRGWTPVLVPVLQNDAVYLKLQDWIGGEGDKPFDTTINNYYLGETDFVTDINDAVNIARDFLTRDLLDDIVAVNNVHFTIEQENELYKLTLHYKDLEGNDYIADIELITDEEISIDDITTSISMLSPTQHAVYDALKRLRHWLIIDDYLQEPWSHEQALSQNAVMNAINAAKAKFEVPIIDLTTDLILQVEGTQGLTNYNPYYMIVAEDNRTGGRHTETCTISCVSQCCDLNVDGGYEERGNREGITGCRCDPGQPEIQAVCRVTITSLGNTGDRYEVILNGLPYTWYDVQPGDTIQDVRDGLIANLPNECTTGRDCNVVNVQSNSFDLIADPGLGSTPNSWTKDVVVTGNAGLTFVQVVQGQDYLAETYRGVRHHLIAYDGTNWYDFGPTLAFGNNSEELQCECTFISMSDTPNTYETFAGYIPIVNTDENALEWINYTFLNLHDTPDTYIGNYRLKVNDAENAVEFVPDTITELEDVEDTHNANQRLKTNDTNDMIEFVDDSITELEDVADTYNANQRLKTNTTGNEVEFIDDTILNLNDIYNTSYTGLDNYVLAVNEAENRMELVDAQTLVNNTFLGLDDVNETYYTGKAMWVPKVTSAEDGLFLAPLTFQPVSPSSPINETSYELTDDNGYLYPQHFALRDNTDDTSTWGEEHAGVMRFVSYIDTNNIKHTVLQVWSLNEDQADNTYDWRDVYHGIYNPGV